MERFRPESSEGRSLWQQAQLKQELEELIGKISESRGNAQRNQNFYQTVETELQDRQKEFHEDPQKEEGFRAYLDTKRSVNYESSDSSGVKNWTRLKSRRTRHTVSL